MMRQLTAMWERTRRYQLLVHFALLVLASEVVLLAWQNRKLKGESGMEQPKESLAVGDYLVTSGLERLSGYTDIADSTAHLVFVFSTKCPFCKINAARWNQLAADLSKRGVRAVGISLDPPDETQEYLKEYDLNFTIYCTTSNAQFQKENRFSRVPKTILRMPSQQITRIWDGVLSKKSTLEALSLASEIKTTNIQSQGGR